MVKDRLPRFRVALEAAFLQMPHLREEIDDVLLALGNDYAAEENAEAAGEIETARMRLKEAFEYVERGGVRR